MCKLKTHIWQKRNKGFLMQWSSITYTKQTKSGKYNKQWNFVANIKLAKPSCYWITILNTANRKIWVWIKRGMKENQINWKTAFSKLCKSVCTGQTSKVDSEVAQEQKGEFTWQ